MRGAAAFFFMVAAFAISSVVPLPSAAQPASDGGAGEAISEKDAFVAAKELGTIEGWNAFLKSFPDGFRSDLARAYVAKLKKGKGPSPAVGAGTAPSAGPAKTAQRRIPPLAAGEVMWDPNFPRVKFSVLLGHTRMLATYRYFVSGDVGFPLCMQECAGDERCRFWAFKPGDFTFKTEDTCYLMEASGRAKRAGDCPDCATGRRLGVSEPIHFQPSLPEYGEIELEREPPPLLGERGRKTKVTKKKPEKSSKTKKTVKVTCVGGWLKNGVCRCSKSKSRTKTGTRSYKCVSKKKTVKKRRCPKGQVWSAEGNQCRDAMAEFCGPGYTPVNGKCVHNADLQPKKPAKKKKAKRRCPKGQVWSAEGNQCRNAAAEFCGPGYTAVKGKCVSNAQLQKKKKPTKPKSSNCQQQINVCLQVCGYVNNASAKAKCQSGCRKSCK